MTLFITILILVFIIATVMWNIKPAWREFMRGYSTKVEAIGAAIIGYGAYFTDWYGTVIETIQETEYADYVPENIATYIPLAILIWAVVKRRQTTTPVGESY